MKQRRSIKNYLDALVDKDGLKTEVTITLTNETLLKIIGALLLSGVTVVMLSHLIKNAFPNMQLAAIQKQIANLK